MQKITPFLWFDNQAEEAAKFYASVFKKAKVGKPVHGPDGKVMLMPFEIDGLEFTALNGGPQFKFSESVSFVVRCKDQDEVDYYWDKLTAAGGKESMCGWLKDKFGLSWQIVPTALPELMTDPDPKVTQSVMKVLLQMKKLDIEGLKRAKQAAR